LSTISIDHDLDLPDERRPVAYGVAAQALSCLREGITFDSVRFVDTWTCELRLPEWGLDPAARARVALALPVLDLVREVVEYAEDGTAASNLTWHALHDWIDDVTEPEQGYHADLHAAGAHVADQFLDVACFVDMNMDTIEILAALMVETGSLAYDTVRRRFGCLLAEPDEFTIADNTERFDGQESVLISIDDALRNSTTALAV
jgi:hypothetical protein